MEKGIIKYWEQVFYDIGNARYQASTTSFHASVSIGFVVLECYQQIIVGGRWVVEIANTTPSTTRRNALCLNILYHTGGRVVDFFATSRAHARERNAREPTDLLCTLNINSKCNSA